MSDNFDKAIAFVLKWESFISNDPNDPGGLTIYGIALKYHPEEIKLMKALIDNGQKDEALKIAKNVYWTKYWNEMGCEEIAWPLCLCVLDTAVNVGVTKAKAFLNTSDDWKDYLIMRIAYYNNLNQKDFIHGWLNRVIDLYATIKMEEHPLSNEEHF